MYFKRVGLKNICVFCASKDGNNENLRVLAQELGEKIALNGLGLVYGGAQIGLMGLVADATLASAGEVIGVIPETLADREVAHPDITSLIVTRDMHERKKRMYELADGVIALPGGMGTLEEIFEADDNAENDFNDFLKKYNSLSWALIRYILEDIAY